MTSQANPAPPSAELIETVRDAAQSMMDLAGHGTAHGFQTVTVRTSSRRGPAGRFYTIGVHVFGTRPGDALGLTSYTKAARAALAAAACEVDAPYTFEHLARI